MFDNFLTGFTEDIDVIFTNQFADLNIAPSIVPRVTAPFSMNFMLPVPEASLLAVEICSETSAAAKIIYNTDDEIRQVLTELVNGTFSSDTELFRDLYNSLLNQNGGERADQYFILADFRSYAAAQKKVEEAYKDEKGWARMAMLNTACAGKFTSDRTIQEYVDDIWHLDKVFVK